MARESEGTAISSHQRFKDTVTNKESMIKGRETSGVGADDAAIEPDVRGEVHAPNMAEA